MVGKNFSRLHLEKFFWYLPENKVWHLGGVCGGGGGGVGGRGGGGVAAEYTWYVCCHFEEGRQPPIRFPVHNFPSEKGSTCILKGKNLLPKGSKFFPYRVDHWPRGSVGCASDWWSGSCGFDPRRVGNIISWRLIMRYFLRSFSPFRCFKKGSCQFLEKECAQYWLTS